MSKKLWTPKVEKVAALQEALGGVIVEYDHIIRQVILLLLADSHGLLRSMPGLGKTMLVNTLQKCIEGTVAGRLQMTPDMKPSDILGFEFYNVKTGEFEQKPGPILEADILLADEVNRTTPKTNAALLQAMQERIVTIGDKTYTLSQLFMVLATINPVEMGGEGTFTLPEAMLDRYLACLEMDYISAEGEVEMAMRDQLHGRDPLANVKPVMNVEDLLKMRAGVNEVAARTSKELVRYIVSLVRSTRPGKPEFDALIKRSGAPLDDMVKFGLSPRAIIGTKRMAAALAFADGRESATPDDVKAVFRDIARHRIIMLETAELNGYTSDHVINAVIDPDRGIPIVDARTAARKPVAETAPATTHGAQNGNGKGKGFWKSLLGG